MRKIVLALTAAVAILGHSATSHANVLPMFDENLGSGTYSLPGLDVWVDGSQYTLAGSRTVTALGYTFDYAGLAGASDMHLWGTVDADPFILYALGVTNNTGSSANYSFTFSLPTVVDNYNFARSTFSASSTDGGNDGVSATPTGSKIQTSTVNGTTNLGVDIGDACIDPAGAPLSQGFTFPDASNTFAPISVSSLEVNVGFGLTGHDAFSANGYTELLVTRDVTPEPNSLMFLGSGLLTFLATRRRKSA